MRVTVIGHAGLYIKTQGATLLVDPWLFGTCYWRSWWHYPPSPEPMPEWLAPDYLYLTHHHFDHFHYPSLRRIDRATKVLIARFGVDVMRDELAALGFNDVTEIDHGESVELDSSMSVASYQYGFDDSALVVVGDGAVVCNLNDCKLRGQDLDGLRKRFGRPDLMLKSHSFAQAYPNCYSAEDPKDLTLLSRKDYVADFLESTSALEPRFAIPFASMVCFLHPESFLRNRDVVTPLEVQEGFARSGQNETTLLLAKPGDTWDSTQPFHSDLGDYYTARDAWLEKLRERAAPALEREAEAESARSLSFGAFAAYFGTFLRALPLGIGLVLRRSVAFRSAESDGTYWVLDWRTRRVRKLDALPLDRACLIEVPPGVLCAAIESRIVNYVHISMRVRIALRKGGVSTDFAFWSLLAAWELGYLPLRDAASRRLFGVAWRRRAEGVGLARATLRQRGSMASRMTSRFMVSDDGYHSSDE